MLRLLFYLPFLAEVGEAQAGGRLMLALFTHAGDDENHQRYHVGEHLEQLLRVGVEAGNVVVSITQRAEQQ